MVRRGFVGRRGHLGFKPAQVGQHAGQPPTGLDGQGVLARTVFQEPLQPRAGLSQLGRPHGRRSGPRQPVGQRDAPLVVQRLLQVRRTLRIAADALQVPERRVMVTALPKPGEKFPRRLGPARAAGRPEHGAQQQGNPRLQRSAYVVAHADRGWN